MQKTWGLGSITKMMNDTLASALSAIGNAEKIGKPICIVKPMSKMLKGVLEIMKNNHYIGDYNIIEDGKGKIVEVNLLGNINKVGVIKPRFSVTKKEFEKFEKRFLPAKDFGLIIVSTSTGMMTHIEAKKKNVGGRLISFVY